jgi:CHAT domain-containing protein/tetratricopeptide (TPR) repeat protein
MGDTGDGVRMRWDLLNLWLLPLLVLLAGSAAAATRPTDIDARIDAIYVDLGHGDNDAALAHSAALLTEVPLRDRGRGDVLQTRLDVLAVRVELNKPPGDALRAAIDVYAPGAKSAGQALSERFAMAQVFDRSDAEGAFKLAQAAIAGAPADAVDLHTLVARIGSFSGHLEVAREQAELALAAWKRRQGACARWHEIEIDYILGQIYTYTASNQDSLRMLRAGSQLAITTFGADSNERMRIDSTLAGVLVDMGRNREALEIREAIYGAASRHYGATSFQAAKAESLIGAGLQEIGDYPSARARYDHAQSLLAALSDTPPQERAIIYVNYGNLLQEMNEYDASLAQYQKSYELIADRKETRHVRAVILANMGNTKLRMRRYEDAIADYRQALILREQSDGKDNPGLAYSLEGLASASLALRHDDEAETAYRRALSLRERAVSPNHPSIGPLRFGLALTRWDQGDRDEAFRLAVQGAEHQQTMLRTFATDFSERQSVAYRDILQPFTALVVTLAAQRGDAESIATAWRLAMVERGLVARTEAHRLAAARAASDPAVAQAFEGWRHANSLLGEAWLGKSTDAPKMQQLTAATEAAERALWRASGQHVVDTGAAATTPADLARALPADGQLIAYSDGMTTDLSRMPATVDHPAPEDWYAFSLHPDGKAQLRRLGSISELTAQARAWYVDLRDPHSDPAQLRRDGTALRQSVLDPLLAANPVQRLFIVPEGELYRVSFAALPDRERGYLVEHGIQVHTLSNEADLTMPAAALESATTLLAGAPNFAAAPVVAGETSRQLCLRATREGFAAIPNAGRELDDLNTLFSASSTNTQIKIVRGADATKQNVLAGMVHANVVHIATHGFSLDESCESSSSSRGVTLQRAPESGVAGLSGLAFNGATVSDGSAPVGVLSAGELATLDLSRVEWIALSACDSGLGPIGRNEGVFGMRRALRLAGARTVVMSLWQVDDAATADLMAALYRARFVAHADVPAAMTTAMRSVIDARRAKGLSDHPYYWAAFIGEGGWR